MGSAIGSALSGLAAAGTRLDVAANNIANDSTKSFVPQKVNQVSIASGGVNAQAQSSPASSLESQLVDVNTASYDFKANLKVLEVQQKTQQSLLNIKT